MALEVAQSLHDSPSAQDAFAHSVFFATLQPVITEHGIVSAIAAATGFQFFGTLPPREQLLNYLRQKRILLVLDNFEHLLAHTDLIEEIFGELQDEFDDEAAIIARDKEGRIYLRGDLLVSDVNEYLELDLPEEAADTLSGLIFSALGHPPTEGVEVRFGDIAVRVEIMEDLGVGEVSLLLPPSDTETRYTEWDIAEHD